MKVQSGPVITQNPFKAQPKKGMGSIAAIDTKAIIVIVKREIMITHIMRPRKNWIN